MRVEYAGVGFPHRRRGGRRLGVVASRQACHSKAEAAGEGMPHISPVGSVKQATYNMCMFTYREVIYVAGCTPAHGYQVAMLCRLIQATDLEPFRFGTPEKHHHTNTRLLFLDLGVRCNVGIAMLSMKQLQ